MAIVFETPEGWFLDHAQYIQQTYTICRRCKSKTTTKCDNSIRQSICSYKYIDDMFAIQTPFMMETHYQALVSSAKESEGMLDTAIKGQPAHKRKKRKRKCNMNEGEEAMAAYHNKVKAILTVALDGVKEHGQKTGLLRCHDSTSCQVLCGENNARARQVAAIQGSGDVLAQLCHEAMLTEARAETTIIAGDRELTNIVNTYVSHVGDTAAVVKALDSDYILPPHSAFLLADMTCLNILVTEGRKFDLILMDPPWENKSVKRKKGYYTIKDSNLTELPVRDLANHNALVVTWVTNKQQQQRFVKETLFPTWGVKPLATWYWLKVTTQCVPICSMEDSHSKKPYEALILGQVQVSSLCHSATDNMLNIPDQKVIVSVPSCLHSQKPPLEEVLRPYVGHDAACLELFARNLLPGWTSWGNEVLKFQHLDYFVDVSPSSPKIVSS